MAARSPESFGYPADHLRSSHGDFPPAFLLIISCHCADNDALVTWKGDQLLIRRYLGVPGFSTLREREIDRVALPQRHREKLRRQSWPLLPRSFASRCFRPTTAHTVMGRDVASRLGLVEDPLERRRYAGSDLWRQYRRAPFPQSPPDSGS